jgi:hypothetical protein
MRIAILGWGSLIWDPRNLPREGVWQLGGPLLPIEFSRVSRDCRLTLVVDLAYGRRVPTRFALSPRSDLSDAIRDLRDREETATKHIGFVCVRDGTSSKRKYPAQQDVFADVLAWCPEKAVDAAVWTALPPSFREETGNEFSPENAIAYLKSLPKSARERAYAYIRNAPGEIVTSVREAFVVQDSQ